MPVIPLATILAPNSLKYGTALVSFAFACIVPKAVRINGRVAIVFGIRKLTSIIFAKAVAFVDASS